MSKRKIAVLKSDQAAGLVRSGDTLTFSGCVGALTPETLLSALEVRFLTTGEPNGLTLVEPTTAGIGSGWEHLAHEKMIKRAISSSLHSPIYPILCQMILDEKIEAYGFPMGVSHQLVREIGRGSPGLVTKVGLHSFLDPRLEGGRYNSITKEELVELVQIRGEEWLLYKSFPINVALIRGTEADEDGNISLEEDPLTLSVLQQAMAAKACGGTVIAQVKRIVNRGSIHPRFVAVPAPLVDYLVVDESQYQCERYPGYDDPSLDGRIRIPPPPGPLHALDEDKVIARRAVLEIHSGDIINIGAGIPTTRMAAITLEEDIQDLITISREHGVLGGISYGRDVHVNPSAWLDYQELFSWYEGGALDIGFLGFAQVDRRGNVNITRFGSEMRGPGGSVDMAYGAQRTILVGTLTGEGPRCKVEDGAIRVVTEGKARKFVNSVQHVTICGQHLRSLGKELLVVTERALFRLEEEGFVLAEVAPGVDLERDVLAQLDFRPIVSPELKTMDARLFRPEPMRLRRDFGAEDAPNARSVPLLPASELRQLPYWSSLATKI